ncbi:MAG: D-alanine--D-alanine ligase, partial [Candidatus Eisenbacteria bacterium]|nr:D-alanine--D-alanine ligase [Candidatus Eisenbacteria bacterium]
YEDKTHRSQRTIEVRCPAAISDETAQRAQQLALDAFNALGCLDCCRVDMRMDGDGQLSILEVNSLPSLGEHGSYVAAAAAVGLDFAGLVNRLVEVASARYFGTPHPPQLPKGTADVPARIFGFLTQRRDEMESELRDWIHRPSRTQDPVGKERAVEELHRRLAGLGLRRREDLTNERVAWTWETTRGLEGGTLFVGHLDVPVDLQAIHQGFRRDPEWLHGEGIGTSRAPLVCFESALRALRHARRLRQLPLGVLYYLDEGADCRYSAETIRRAAGLASRVLVLRPGGTGDTIITRRRGRSTYKLEIQGSPHRPGQRGKRVDVMQWASARFADLAALTSSSDRLSVSVTHVHTYAYPMLLPHFVSATVLITYRDPRAAARIEERMRSLLGRDGFSWRLNLVSARPAMGEGRASLRLARDLVRTAEEWGIPIRKDSSLLPSAAGLVGSRIGAICGIGPVARDLYTPQEAVLRLSLLQRALLLAQFLARESGG